METQTYPRDQLRASDADRDRAIAELSEHFQAGRLTQEEFDERTGHALQARTGQDLAALFTDLPHDHAPGNAPPAAGQDQPVQPYRAPIPRIAVAVCAIIVAGSILGGSSGHHGWFALAPIIIVLVIIRYLAGGRRRAWDHRAWDHRDRDHRDWDHRPR